MFRSTRANARRISLLASSSFLASTLMAGAGGMALTAMTPVIALANPVCNTGAPDGTYAAPAASAGTFTCGPGPAASLGFTSATGTNLYTSGNLVVNAGGLKVISTGNGIIVIEQSPVTVTSGGFINATGSGEDGIYAKSAGGNVTVINGTTAVPFAVTGDDYGLYAETTGTATVSVTAASNVTGVLKSGIIAYTGSGLSTVTVNHNVTVSGGTTFFGSAQAGGSASLVNNGAITGSAGAELKTTGASTVTGTGSFTGSTGDALYLNTGGLATVNSTGTFTGGTAGDGIDIVSTGGAHVINTGNVSGDPGIVVTDNSAVGITVTPGGTVTGLTGGIITTENGTGPTSITNNFTVTGGTGAGISATSNNAAGGVVGVTANANVTGASGISAYNKDTANNGVSVVVGSALITGVHVTGTNGVGISAHTAATSGHELASVTLHGGAYVSATHGNGIVAQSDGGANSFQTDAQVVIDGTNGAINVTGGNNGLVGIEAFSHTVVSSSGTALVDTSGNTGLAINVGLSGGNGDFGILSVTDDTAGPEAGHVKLGDTQTVKVGNSASTGSVGIAALAPNIVNAGATTYVYGGNGDTIHVYGTAARGVEATSSIDNVAITFGTGAAGLVKVSDPAVNNSSIGVLASTGGAGTVTIKMGNTTVYNNNGTAIEALGKDGNIYVSTQANVLSYFGGGDGIFAQSTGAGNITITDGAAAPTAAHIEATDNAAQSGIVAIETGTATGGININFNGTIGLTTPVSHYGIEARINNAADTHNITINAATIYAGGDGILAVNYGSGNIAISTDVNTSITTTGGQGIEGIANGVGSVSVTDGQAVNGTNTGHIDASGTGIEAIANIGGGVNVNFHGFIGYNAAVGNDGVFAENVGGTANINVTVGNIHSTNTGIFALQTGTGNINITTDKGTNITSQLADGIDAFNVGGGNVNITLLDGSITALNSNGSGTGAGTGTGLPLPVLDPHDVYSQVVGNGYANIDIQSNQINVGPGAAVLSRSYNGVNFVHFDNVNGNDPFIHQTNPGSGIYVFSTGNVLVAGTGPVAGKTGLYVLADAGTDIEANHGNGITAIAFGTGAVSAGKDIVTVIDHGNIGANKAVFYSGIVAEIVNGQSGNIRVQGDNINAYGYGIAAVTNGAGNVIVGTDAGGAVNAVYGSGIIAETFTTGNTSVTVGGHVHSNYSDGVVAVGGTGGGALGAADGVTITVNGSVSAPNGEGLDVFSGNNVHISTGAGSSISGLGDAVAALGGTSLSTHAVVSVSTPAGATMTLNNLGTITSASASAHSFGDLAVLESVGNVVINNGGAIDGRMWFGGLTGTSTVTMHNGGATAGLWQFSGKSLLSANADTITNGGAAAGVIATADNGKLTTLDFGAGADTLNNTSTGVIVAGEGTIPGATTSGAEATPAVTLINNLETFTNNGLIVLGGSAGSTKSDGKIDSVLDTTGSTATLTGSGIIALDANLWSDNSQTAAGCAAHTLTVADCLVVPATAGNEGIRVTDTKAHAFGAFNPIGIVIVAGSSGAGTFHLDAGSNYFVAGGTGEFGGATNVLDKPGMFFYDLAFDGGDHTERLIGVPKAAAFEFASVAGAATDVWYATTQTWFDRQADLRDGIEGRMTGGKPGVWLKAVGDWSRRTHTDVFSDFNKTYVFNVSYDQDTAALIGGVDFLDVTNKDQAWVLGVEGGAVDSNIRFRFSGDRFHLNGTDFGGYATYISGPLFVDATINANFLTLDSSLPLNTNPNPWTASSHVTTVGGQVESGYEVPLGSMAFVEPLGTISYVSGNLGTVAVPGGVVLNGHDDSFRGSLGARIGASAAYQYYKVKVAITGRVWDEFNNRPATLVVVAGGPNFPNSDSLTGVFGEVSGQANLFSTTSGFSAFLSGGVKFKSAYTEGTATLGARYQW